MPLSLDKIKSLIRLANKNPNEHEANLAARKVCQQLTESQVEQVAGTRKTAAGKVNEAIFKEWVDPRTGELTIQISQLELVNNTKILDLLKQLKTEITRPRTWNDVKRSTEPAWRAKPPDPKPPYTSSEYDTSSSPYDDIFKEMFGKEMYERMKRDAEEAKRNEEKRQKHASNYQRPHSDNPFTGGRRGGKSWDWMGFDWSKAPHVDAPEDNSWDKETKGSWESSRYKPPPEPPRYEDPNFTWTTDPVTGQRVPNKKKKPQELRKCVQCGLEIMTFRINENPWRCQWCYWGKEKL